MLDLEIVGGDEEVNGIEVVLGVLGKGVSFAHQATHSCSQGAKEAFDVVGLALVFAAGAVSSFGKSVWVGFPVVAAGVATLVVLGQGGPQVTRALLAAVAQGPSHDLARAPTQGYPQPERPRLAAHQAPEFIQLQHVVLLAGQERVLESRQSFRFFPPARP